MSWSRWIAVGVCVVVLLGVTGVAEGHRKHYPQDVEFTAERLTDRTWVLYGRGGNVGFWVSDDGVVIVDDQFEEIAPGIEAELREITPVPIRFLINTHHHGDHTGGNPHFRELTTIVAHHEVYENLRARAEDAAALRRVAPHLTYDRDITIHLAGEEIRAFHLGRGHTSGDSVIWFPGENVVHMGDLHFNGMHPFIDVDAGASVVQWVAFLDGVLERLPDDARVIPGHGRVTGVDGLQAFRDAMQAMIDRVAQAIEDGWSRERTVEELEIPEMAGWEGTDRGRANIGITYDELSGEGQP